MKPPPHEEARYAQYKVIRRNGAVVGFEPSKISIAMTKAFIAVNGGQGAASARVREQVAIAHRERGGRADAPPALGRHLPHRGHPGPGRAGADARRRAQRRARLRALPRGAVEGARAKEREAQDQGKRAQQPAINVKEGGQLQPLDLRRITRAGARGVRRARARGERGARSAGDAARPLRRRADGGSAQVAHPRRARADRAGPGLQLRHRAAAAALAAAGDAGRGSDAGGDARALRRVPAGVHQDRASRRSCSTSASRATT